MLTDEEKTRIRAEEVFRAEIQRELVENKEDTSKRVWKIVNSAIVLWLLSTVVVGAIVHFYNKHAETRSKHNAMSEAARKIAIELQYRCQSCRQFMETAGSDPIANYGRAAQALDGVTSGFVFPEHRGRTLTSLGHEYEGTLVGRDLDRTLLPFLSGLPTTSDELLRREADKERHPEILSNTVTQIEKEIVDRELN